jgi:hypothetical protein
MNLLKEADYIRYSSVKRVLNLSKQDQQSLWTGIVQDDFNSHDKILSQMLGPPQEWKQIPVKVYVNQTMRMFKIQPMTSDNAYKTLEDVLKEITPADPIPEVLKCHGIEISLKNLDILTAAQVLSYPDTFLYLCLNKDTGQEKLL